MRAQPRGAAVPVTVGAANGAAPRRCWRGPDIEELMRGLPDPPRRLRVLNPFDPLLRDRHRLSRLFAFDYRIEVFVPAPRRQWGYYVFPLLEGERLVGRLDMKAARAAGTLDVTALWLEPGCASAGGARNASRPSSTASGASSGSTRSASRTATSGGAGEPGPRQLAARAAPWLTRRPPGGRRGPSG